MGDIDSNLMNAYHVIKHEWEKVEVGLIERQDKHTRNPAYYYEQRAQEPHDSIERALRMLYLNKTCFNGIYRVNKKGQFNMPKGSIKAVVLSNDNFQQRAKLLQKVELHVSDFRPLIDQTVGGDFVFADPPYALPHNHQSFVRYNPLKFSWHDQERLAYSLFQAKERGVKIMVTNENHESVRNLYSNSSFNLRKVVRYSSIAANPAKRKPYNELIISENL